MSAQHSIAGRRPRSIVLAAVLLVLGVIVSGLAAPAAWAAPTATVMVQTQRMSDATLQSTQNGWYSKGAVLQLTCYKRGQSVKGYYSPWIAGGYDNLWYRVSDGYYVADVDINTGSNDPIAPACGASGPSPVGIDTNAWFTLTARNSGLVVDLRGGASANGTAVQQYPRNGSNAQKFRFVATDSGYYRILSALNGSQVLDVAGGGAANGSKAHVWTWGGGANQQWMAVDAGNGYVSLRPRHVGRCLDVPGGSTTASVQLQIYDCNGTTSQQFFRAVVGTIAQPGRFQVPFAAGQKWQVCQGYRGTPSHTGDPALDVTTDTSRGRDGCYGNASAAAGQPVYAPESGSLALVSADFGGVCITFPSGDSMYLGHLVNWRGNGAVAKGDRIGTVAPPNQARNNGYSHVHLSMRSGAGCGGTKVPFDTAHNARFIGLPDLTDNQTPNQWAGTTFLR